MDTCMTRKNKKTRMLFWNMEKGNRAVVEELKQRIEANPRKIQCYTDRRKQKHHIGYFFIGYTSKTVIKRIR